MKDLRKYTDSELSLLVFNDEYFYNERKNIPYLKALIKEEFLYTDAQMLELVNDLRDDELEDKPSPPNWFNEDIKTFCINHLKKKK